MANVNTSKILESLAAEIGENIYIDIAKWHLYLADAKLHAVVAEKMYPLLAENNVNENRVVELLGTIEVKIGGGRRELMLIDLLPMQCQVNLVDILEKFQKEM